MEVVSTMPRGRASVKFRRAALAVQWSVNANNVMRIRRMYADVAIEPKEDTVIEEVIKSDPIQPCLEEPALKTEMRPLAALQSFSDRQLNASVKFRRAAIIVRLAVIAKKSNPPRTLPESQIKPETMAPEIEKEKEIEAAKSQTSFKFRRAAIAVELFLKANRLIHQAHSKVESTSKQEAQNIIDNTMSCIEDIASEFAPVEDATLVVAPIAGASVEVAPIEETVIEVSASEVEKTKEVAEVTEEEQELPVLEVVSDMSSSDLSCLSDSSSPSKTKKSVTMKKKTRIRKIPTRTSYTEEEVASVWYSRPELQKMQDKLAKKMRASGISVYNFWVLDGAFEPTSKPQVAGKAPKKKRHSSSSSLSKSSNHSSSKSSKPQEAQATPKSKSHSSLSSKSSKPQEDGKTPKKKRQSSSSSLSSKSSKPQEADKAPKKKRPSSSSSISKKEKDTSKGSTSKVKKPKSLSGLGSDTLPMKLNIDVHQMQVSNRAA
jgi:hypothetical protein